jgi:hypothetical protein
VAVGVDGKFGSTYNGEKWEETTVILWDGGVGIIMPGEVSFSSQHHFLKSICTQCNVVIY